MHIHALPTEKTQNILREFNVLSIFGVGIEGRNASAFCMATIDFPFKCDEVFIRHCGLLLLCKISC